MKVKILKSSMNSYWYSNDVNKEFNVHYNITDRSDPFRHCITTHFIRNEDAVITELPESFCVKRCDDGIKWGKYIQWLNKNYNTDFCGRMFNSDSPYYGVIDDEGWGIKLPFGTEIHIDDMIKHIDYMESQQHINGGEQFHKESQLTVKKDKIIKEETNMETQKLSRQGLKEIHSVACSSWKLALETSGLRNPLEDYVELTQEEVDKMFRACTKEQLPIVSKYLKHDDGIVDVTKFTLSGKGFCDDNFYIIRDREWGEYKKQSFLLSERYDWEIKTDDVVQLCLIPTKKK